MADTAKRKKRTANGKHGPSGPRKSGNGHGGEPHDQGTVLDERGQDQPADKKRAQENR